MTDPRADTTHLSRPPGRVRRGMRWFTWWVVVGGCGALAIALAALDHLPQ